jgi:hypothetical protein
MRKVIVGLVVALVLSALFVTPVLANGPGNGMPAAHGVDGKTFGMLVSGLAQSEPGAVAEHVRMCQDGSSGGGMPAAHGVDGKTFGTMVSGLAQSYPGAVADHVSGN